MADEETSQTPTPAVEPTATPPEATQSEPKPAEVPTAQIPANEPLPPEPEPTPPAPEPTPAPQSAPAAAPAATAARDLLVKARATIQFGKTAKLEKILTVLQKKNHITNDEVEKLLHVSDSTAQRYLKQLVQEGRLRQVGKPEVAQYESV